MAVILSIVLALVISCMAVSTAHAAQRLPWNGREIEGWVCDGNVLKPKHGANSSNTWIYANGVIKPKYGANSSNTWIFNGKELKPKYGANSSNTWVFDGKRIKPKYGANSYNTFEVGDAPLLVIAGATVLRLF